VKEVFIMKDCCGDMGEMEGMMSKMMGSGSTEMMMEMMPECLGMMLNKMPQEKRAEVVKKLFSVLLDKGCTGMTEEDKKDLVNKIMGTGGV
jgi:hypothetical protein